MKTSPRIYLVLDNCFAIKRWVKPRDWMEVTKDLGFRYAQASTDNEIDPLFSTSDYMDEWFSQVRQAQQKTGIKVVNFYTGYQTYRTVGLAHFYPGMVRHLKENWIFRMVDRASGLDHAGVGFSLFAVPERVMQQPDEYAKAEESLLGILREVGDYSYERGVKVSFEQMYVPYQPPFTIEQSERYLRECYVPKKHPLYVTLDTGHMIGQVKYQKPNREQLIESFQREWPETWLGGDAQYAEWEDGKRSGRHEESADAILRGMEQYPHLFAAPGDMDEFLWFEKLAKYSPIVHMQQTNGVTAGHVSFTPEANRAGIITGERLLGAIAKSYDSPDEIQPPAEDIYLSFELFFSNTEKKHVIFRHLRQTLEYWRQFIPEDGIRLNEALARLR